MLNNTNMATSISNSPRVAFVAGGIELGGATTFLLNLGGELVRRGVPTLVVSLEADNPYASDFEKRNLPLHIEDEGKKIFEDRLCSALNAIRDFRPTAVIATLGPSSYEVLRYVPSSVARLAMLQSDFAESYQILGRYSEVTDAMIGVSAEIARRLRSIPALSSKRIECIPYGVPIPNAAPVRKPSSSDRLRILYLGRLSREQKRVHLFPEVFHALRATPGISFLWTIAGDGRELSELKRQMVSESPKAVVAFTGAINYDDVPALLREHDVYLLTSDHEGLPLSLLEAMAHGLVPVVSDLRSGVSEIVDLTNGILVSTDDTAGYAKAIARLHADRSELMAKSAAARARVTQEYSVQAMADRWLAILHPLSKPVTWPGEFEIQAPLGNSQPWKYGATIRFLRRLTKPFIGTAQR